MIELQEQGLVDDQRASKSVRVAYDPRISLNTILMCLTAIGVSWGLIDKITASAAVTATIQADAKSNASAIVQLQQQRVIDRQELLLELRDIKGEISKIRK